MEIIKRDGSVAEYKKEKIERAMRKSFASIGEPVDDSKIQIMVDAVERFVVEHPEKRNVESIQDAVELTLMSHGFFNVAKSFILFRYQRTEQRNTLRKIVDELSEPALEQTLRAIAQNYMQPEYGLIHLSEKFFSFIKPGMKPVDKLNSLIKAAVELTTQEAPQWEFIASRLLSFKLNKEIAEVEAVVGVANYYEKLRYLVNDKLFGDYILDAYTQQEIEEAFTFIVPSRNELLNYSGLDLLTKRYLIRTYNQKPIESVQEMFLGIALHLAMHEDRAQRLSWVRRFYDMLSQLQVTMATPTLSNARKPFHQLSSCFIDTVPDSLDGIYRSIDNFAKVSKFGGGMGMYFGKVRAAGAKIRGFKGAAGGVIRWMKLVNDTAVAVDQLGMRQGAVAVYLDVWHRDLPEFLQLRTNNGDDRMKAHDIFPAICYPDLFWRMAEEDLNQQWCMFCPNEVMSVKGYCLEDYYG
ncbi:MAG: ribonucleoside-diphosphate reductase subunit alpha, partial [Bacteroidaceae bacterium]|nr:ribonucleoside-diphosphate reductase subunit alpha [Bacteroidaceae bacterium]